MKEMKVDMQGMDMDGGDDMDMGGGDMDMMMYMNFWHGNQVTWLIHGVDSTNNTQYAGGLIITFLLAFAVEALMYLRNFTYIKS